ncbi:uncharacterized protein LOC109847898 [Asparagus officinalis]|uniref:uncharacterized protein LOC109847898 n=1 Tax=Asparagus officinalis TaxID=4686 RepID=UPI00098E2CF5|nr:uncharacterized protein LOC109847898 [Asparagus officinalis]
MNFGVGDPSYLSSSSSSDDDNFLSNIIAEIDETKEVICEYINNNMIIANNLRQQNYQPIHGGSIPGHAVTNHDRETAHQNLVIDYFADNPRFGEDMFRRRYRMSRTDATDEYVKTCESTAIESMTRFCRAMVEIFAERNLRTPNANDIARLLYIAWSGQYAGRSGSLTIILEAVADYDLWIWHAYFGMPGTNNDINVLESSNLFSNLAQCIAPLAHYVIQGKEYNMGYYLADGIYPKWATIVQTIQQPQGRKKKYFAMKQEACRKDVQRAFGVLQSRFAIVAGSARF